MEEGNQELEAGAPLMAVAAAAAAAPNEPLDQLLDIVRPIYRQIRRRKKGGHDDIANNSHNENDQDGELLIRLGHLLEASAGNIHLAAALFLDDFVASTALTDSHRNNPPPPKDQRKSKTSDTYQENEESLDHKKSSGDDEVEDEDEDDKMEEEKEAQPWMLKGEKCSFDNSRLLFKQLGKNPYSKDTAARMQSGQDKQKLCDRCGSSGHNVWYCPEPPNVCGRCGRMGHSATTCSELPPPPAPQEDTDDEDDNDDEGEGNDDVQIRLQENQNPSDARVSISDDEIRFDPNDLTSLRRKWLGHTCSRSSRSHLFQLENALHSSHSHKRVKRKSSTSASTELNLDEQIQNKSLRRSKGSSSSFDSFYSCDSPNDNDSVHDTKKDEDFTDKDDDSTEKAVCGGRHNNTKSASDGYGYWFKYEDLFERSHDSEPSLLLWGPPAQIKDPESEPSRVDDTRAQVRQQQGRPPLEPAGNIVGANPNPVENDNALNPNIAHDLDMTIIPWTWSSCGFQLSSCGTGLILPQPDTDTLQTIKKVHAAHRRAASSILPGKVPPIPSAYCGGVTALVSLVTALLYSGSTIVGNEVNCHNDRKGFAEMSVEERKSEFPRRLSDALSSILFIAAKESHEKRKFAITLLESELNKARRNETATVSNNSSDVDPDNSLDPSRDDCELMIKQDLHRQCRLVPVCRWETEQSEVKKQPRLSISISHLEDLRLFVHSNISQFMNPGGIALLLECLVHIYGRNRLAKALRKQRRNSGKKAYTRSLISCNCIEGQFHDWQQQELANKYKPVISMSHDSSATIQPHQHKCLSIELLSLILTGQVNTDVSSWTTKFGVGLLSADKVEGIALSHAMKYPSNSIWLVRGLSSYSVLWHNELMHKDADLLQPFSLVQWSPWYTGLNKSTLKVIPCYCNKVADHLCEKDNKNCTDVEYSVTCHPDDKILHPGNYQRWRFNLKPVFHEYLDNGIDQEEKACASWIPYYRLSMIQKSIIDKKMSPQITLAIWSRWNAARVDAISNDK